MKTAPNVQLGAVDVQMESASWNRAKASAQYALPPQAYQHWHPSVLRKLVQSKPAGRTRNGYPDATGCPLLPAPNGDERVPQVREPEGKVGSSCLVHMQVVVLEKDAGSRLVTTDPREVGATPTYLPK
jgi:hypothetical protein